MRTLAEALERGEDEAWLTSLRLQLEEKQAPGPIVVIVP